MADAIGRIPTALPSSPASTLRSVLVLPNTVQNGEGTAAELHAAMDLLTRDGAEVGHSLKNVAGFTASIKPGQEKALEAQGLRVLDDTKVQSVPSWRPEAQRTWSVQPDASEQGPAAFIGNQPLPYTGKGVTIAILDTGITPHPDFKDRIVAFKDLATGERQLSDNVGHGTHVAGDAAGNGKMSGGQFHSLAPEASIAAVKVLDAEGSDNLSDTVDNMVGGLNWCVQNKDRYNIRVINMSLHIPLLRDRSEDDYGQTTLYDPIGQAVDNAVKAGITVVVAAGNDGEHGEGSLNGSPAINENALTVGAADFTQGRPHVADFSSRGPAPDGSAKPDIVAPGVAVMAANDPGGDLDKMNQHSSEIKETLQNASDQQIQRMAYRLVVSGQAPEEVMDMDPSELREKLAETIHTMPTAGHLGDSSAYIGMDGTSMASPVVAGLVADIAQANPDLSPAQIKQVLEQTATPLPGEDRYSEGAGLINPQKALKLAESLRGKPVAAAPQPQPSVPQPAPHRHWGMRDFLSDLMAG
ncbi:MAG: S8 family peptidase [Candidatus Xenobia bacterium]